MTDATLPTASDVSENSSLPPDSAAPNLSAPVSPQRLTSTPAAGSPNSVQRSVATTPLDRSPLPPHMDAAMDGAIPVLPQVEPAGVVLGIQQLERQQYQHELRRQVVPQQRSSSVPLQVTMPQMPAYSSQPQQQQRDPATDDDENTQSSSTVTGNTAENRGQAGPQRSTSGSKFSRLVKSTRRRLSSSSAGRDEDSDPLDEEEGEMYEGALIYGYLQKLGRNGKWQTRWFETDGESLTYFKSNKRIKLLASLDLAKVGAIAVNHEDPRGCSFTIQVSDRPYHLRCLTKASCKDWVISLNRIKEARMQQGNVKLVSPKNNKKKFMQPPDLLDPVDSSDRTDYSSRVVVVANRQRTRAVDDSGIDSWEQLVVTGTDDSSYRQGEVELMIPEHGSMNSSLSQVVVARWQKRKTSIEKLAGKVLRWARSLRKYNCQDVNYNMPVQLDKHVHPPGHDDVRSRVAQARMNAAGFGTVEVSKTSEEAPGIEKTADPLSHSSNSSAATPSKDENDETRELS